ncbi:hypothetical protein KIPB_010946 [Kipferlia bialata]|uniref:HAT C-terminal dimerisation domain-containing protein n=1 Tax=Kipferlia bialata TaxID=797122 RepID=A0A9K3GLX8_9EUKA|nr:hypothetical protein KIPB_010946 [Kipferlia bialata]|eukprot:g10946.t1
MLFRNRWRDGFNKDVLALVQVFLPSRQQQDLGLGGFIDTSKIAHMVMDFAKEYMAFIGRADDFDERMFKRQFLRYRARALPGMPAPSTNPFEYWAEVSFDDRYEVLAKVAQAAPGLPASQAAVERSFSHQKHVISALRCSTSTIVAQATMFLRYNLKFLARTLFKGETELIEAIIAREEAEEDEESSDDIGSVGEADLEWISENEGGEMGDVDVVECSDQ